MDKCYVVCKDIITYNHKGISDVTTQIVKVFKNEADASAYIDAANRHIDGFQHYFSEEEFDNGN